MLFINVHIWRKGSNDAMRMYIRWTAMKPQKEPLKTSKRNKNIGKNWVWNSCRNHIISPACLAIVFVGHNLGLQLNLVKNPKLWKCIVFSNIWVFWKQSIVKPKFCLETKFWKWTSGKYAFPAQARGHFYHAHGPYGFLESWRIDWSPFSKVGF